MSSRIPLPWKIAITIVGFCLPFCFVAGVLLSDHLREYDPDAVLGPLRINTMIYMRYVEDDQAIEMISVHEDGGAARCPARTPDRLPVPEDCTRVTLTEDDWQAANHLREQWCQSPPQVRELDPREPRYITVLRCSGSHDRVVRIPADDLPPILAHLWEWIPVPCSRC
jgi:hypothetical protein